MTVTDPSTISKAEANHVLFHYREGGWEPGGFTGDLICAFTRADRTNFAKLASVYPGYAAAVRLARDDLDGIAVLRQIAGRR